MRVDLADESSSVHHGAVDVPQGSSNRSFLADRSVGDRGQGLMLRSELDRGQVVQAHVRPDRVVVMTAVYEEGRRTHPDLPLTLEGSVQCISGRFDSPVHKSSLAWPLLARLPSACPR